MLLKSSIAVFICDFLFMISAALISVVFSVGFARGNTRYFIVFGEFCGFIIWRLTLGRVSVSAAEFLWNKSSIVFKKIFRKIIKSLKKVLQETRSLLYNIIRKMVSSNRKHILKRGNSHYET